MRRSLLIVDDNPGDRALIELATRETGWNVRVALVASGYAVEALDAQSREDRLPDIVLVDLNMPGVSGWDLLGRMQDERFESVRRFVLTSSTNRADHELALELAAERVFTKPLSFEGLVEVIDEIRRMFESGSHRTVPTPC